MYFPDGVLTHLTPLDIGPDFFGGFDAAFARLLWWLVICRIGLQYLMSVVWCDSL